MTSTTWRTALLATGAALAASSLLIAGCSKKDGDMSDSGGSDPNIPASTSPSSSSTGARAGAGSGAPMASTDASPTVSTAGAISPGAGLTNDSSTMSSSPPVPPASTSSDTTSSSPGRATGPRS